MTDTSREAAWDALMNYQQADEEGVMVLVSRQAVHECKDERDALLSERDEADRMAGAAERRNAAELADLKDCVQGQAEWLREAKAERGYSDEVSFDRVWAEVCALAAERDTLAKQAEDCARTCAEQAGKIQTLTGQLAEARNALKVYACKQNWANGAEWNGLHAPRIVALEALKSTSAEGEG